jgi:hypothetical protein
MKTKMINFRCVFALAVSMWAVSAVANDPIWTADRIHSDNSHDEWAIHPAVEPASPLSLTDALKSIYEKDKQPVIRHIALGSLFKRADLQAEVVTFLQKQEDFQNTPPPYGKNKWDFENSGKMQKLVSQALLQSKFAESLNKDLAAYGWKITSVSMEKLFFTKENDKPVWQAIVWLNLAKEDENH